MFRILYMNRTAAELFDIVNEWMHNNTDSKSEMILINKRIAKEKNHAKYV